MVSDEIRATVIDHVINQGLMMREAGQTVQTNIYSGGYNSNL